MQFLLTCITLVVLVLTCNATLQEQYDRLQKRALLSDPVTGTCLAYSCASPNVAIYLFDGFLSKLG